MVDLQLTNRELAGRIDNNVPEELKSLPQCTLAKDKKGRWAAGRKKWFLKPWVKIGDKLYKRERLSASTVYSKKPEPL